MMLSLGFFVFELGTLPYQELQRRTAWRHPETSRVGARPARQFTGPGDDSFNLSGIIMTELVGDRASLVTLRDMGDTGDAWPLVAGDGTVHGAFVILDLSETGSVLHADGTPRRIEFDLALARVDDADALAR